jgi:glycosyltransferase involved in cell wall biosynthesis
MLVMNDMRADARVDREASALASAGHEVTVLALRSPDASGSEERPGFLVRRVADYSTATWARAWVKLSEGRARTREMTEAAVGLRPDVVHAHDSDTLEAGVAAASATGATLVYDAHELYPDMLQEHGMQGSPPVQAYWRRIERRCVPRADAVITVSDGLAGELARRFGVAPVVVANVPALTPVSTTGRLRRELDLAADVPLAIYQGVLISGRGLDRLVRAWTCVPDAVLVIQGFGPAEAGMRDMAAAAAATDRVRFMGRIAPGDLHEYACGADVGIVIYERTTLNNYLAAPNKLFAYLMAGLAVASSDFPGLARIVTGQGAGTVFDPADEASIARAVSELFSDPPALASMRARARKAAERTYNWDIEKLKLLALYERLAARSTS